MRHLLVGTDGNPGPSAAAAAPAAAAVVALLVVPDDGPGGVVIAVLLDDAFNGLKKMLVDLLRPLFLVI